MFDFNGEPARVRTVDLLIKSQLLYQLSYGLPRPLKSGGTQAENLNQRSRKAWLNWSLNGFSR